MIEVIEQKDQRIRQGDIFSNIEFIEYAEEVGGNISISKINFPLVIVLTQDCDLAQDFSNRNKENAINQDKFLFSVIVAPLYNIEHIYSGEHLSELGLKMQQINKNQSKTDNKFLRNNQNPRYHYLEFPENIQIVNSVVDFKHYFTTNINYLKSKIEANFICKVSELYREDISQRFSSFLSRIGLPD